MLAVNDDQERLTEHGNERVVELSRCVGCDGMFPTIDGPAHRYMKSSAGYREVYGEVLSREYSDAAFWAVHRLTADTYAVQHPGLPCRQAIQSVGAHLIRIHLILERVLRKNRPQPLTSDWENT